eukprot:9489648-Pyramimonas_sp.AAC.1
MYGALKIGENTRAAAAENLSDRPMRLRGKAPPSGDEKPYVNPLETAEEATEDHTVTAGLSILAGAFERADENILPAVFKGLERDLQWRPSQLGQLVMARTLVMAITSPIFGTLADANIGRRERLIGWSCFGYARGLELYQPIGASV